MLLQKQTPQMDADARNRSRAVLPTAGLIRDDEGVTNDVPDGRLGPV
jgi:hypothetical protein